MTDMILEADQIPKVDEVVDVSMDDPMEVYKICQRMEILCDADNGIGLSAVQVGIPWKLFLVKSDGSNP
ncbi:MAG: peptide deformylase, partial [Candidatus Thorarchaeota archaeon]